MVPVIKQLGRLITGKDEKLVIKKSLDFSVHDCMIAVTLLSDWLI